MTHVKTITTRTRAQQDTLDKMKPEEKVLNLMVDQCKMHDEMFYETGVENEVFEQALLYYVLNKDPEIQAKMTDYMTNMKKEMATAKTE